MQTIKNTVAGTFAIAAAFITVAVATPLRAEQVSVPVAYGDLNVTSDKGAAALEARIGRAARIACGYSDVGNSLQVATCRRDAVENAKAKLAMVQSGAQLKLAAR